VKFSVFIKKTLNSIGIEAHRFNPQSSSLARLIAALRAHEIDLIFDVGANEGQFALELRIGGYSGQIVSFEPLTTAHDRLMQACRGDSSWHVASRCAVGDRQGEVQINIAGNSVSSSILPMLDEHASAAPESIYCANECSPLITVDSMAQEFIANAKAPFLKIDTQGYEWHVLDGARLTLPRLTGISMELSSVPLYEGQRLWRESIERVEAAGFTLWSLEPVFTDPNSGRTLQWDGLFFRQ
jgi:FkbM family methyltransferase